MPAASNINYRDYIERETYTGITIMTYVLLDTVSVYVTNNLGNKYLFLS